MDNGTFLIVVINCAHPSGELKYWLLEGENENAMTFSSEEEADAYIAEIDNDIFPIAYKVVEV